MTALSLGTLRRLGREGEAGAGSGKAASLGVESGVGVLHGAVLRPLTGA